MSSVQWRTEGPAPFIQDNRAELVARLDGADLSPEVHLGDARDLSFLEDGAVQLVVTSPPYPYIEMWDEQLADLLGLPGDAFDRSPDHFGACHDLLAEVWAECARVLAPGGMLAINVGDATRTVDGQFRCFHNHAAITSRCEALGLTPLIPILWKKPTNKPNAFLGSGFLPTNGYVTLDCEFILLFRKGDKRVFEPKDPLRYASAFSKEERDRWFSQVWHIQGARQEGMAVFPEAVPYRLVRMFSALGDVVLDPFLGSGQTVRMARALGRKGIGVEIDEALGPVLSERIEQRALTPQEVLDNLLSLYGLGEGPLEVGGAVRR